VGSDSTPLLAVAVYEEALRDPLSALDPARLHHMTYRRLRREWLIDLQPLCHTPCHKIVTEVSRLLRPSLPTRQATYLVWLLARTPLVFAGPGWACDSLMAPRRWSSGRPTPD
jgi:hypothetical protein